VIPATSPRSSEVGANYFETEPHYTALAGRIIIALRGGRNFVVVTGDPPASPRLLSQALSKLAAASGAVINVRCGPELTRDEVWRAASVVARLPETLMFETSQLPAVLFVFDNAGRLSNRQIKDIYEAIQHGDRVGAAGVLLARPGFLFRLAAPALGFLKGGLAGQFNFQEVGQDESVELLRYQFANRDGSADARRAPRGVIRVVMALAVLVMAGIGAFSIFRPAEQAGEKSARSAAGSSSTGEASPPRSMPNEMTYVLGPAATVDPVQQAARAPEATSPVAAPATPQPAQVPQAISPSAAPDPVQPARAQDATSSQATPQATPPIALPPSGKSPTGIAALVARGDSFLGAGDIASARLFYERAADAGDGHAALRLGATFDPDFLDRAGMRSIRADPEQASSWYRRARELGDTAAGNR
jgi:TPR repeat protein